MKCFIVVLKQNFWDFQFQSKRVTESTKPLQSVKILIKFFRASYSKELLKEDGSEREFNHVYSRT